MEFVAKNICLLSCTIPWPRCGWWQESLQLGNRRAGEGKWSMNEWSVVCTTHLLLQCSFLHGVSRLALLALCVLQNILPISQRLCLDPAKIIAIHLFLGGKRSAKQTIFFHHDHHRRLGKARASLFVPGSALLMHLSHDV